MTLSFEHTFGCIEYFSREVRKKKEKLPLARGTRHLSWGESPFRVNPKGQFYERRDAPKTPTTTPQGGQ